MQCIIGCLSLSPLFLCLSDLEKNVSSFDYYYCKCSPVTWDLGLADSKDKNVPAAPYELGLGGGE